MWSGIVLLQNQINLLHKRDCNRTQDLIPIPYCGHIACNNDQLWFYPVSNASPDHNGATPKPIPFDNTGVGKAFSATSAHTTSTICAIESEPRLVRKKNSSPLPHRKLPGRMRRQPRHTTQPTCLGQSRPTYGRRARRPISRNRLQTVFREICRLCVPTVLRAVSVAVRWFRKCARRIVLSWRRDVTRGRPDRGRSAKCPVSLKRLTRRSIVETLTPKWLATYCCLWPCISNANALPLWTSVNRTMIEKSSK